MIKESNTFAFPSLAALLCLKVKGKTTDISNKRKEIRKRTRYRRESTKTREKNSNSNKKQVQKQRLKGQRLKR